MRIDSLVVQQGSLRVETDNLASGTVSRIDAHHPFLSQRRCQKQLAQVAREHADSLIVCLFLARRGKLGLNAWLYQAFIGVSYRVGNLMRAFIVSPYEFPFKSFGAVRVIGRDGHFQDAFRFSSPYGQEAV